MAKIRTLFGRKIVAHHMLNYAEQVYDILVGEIELGRWSINERLPGVMALAKELGFGTKTVQSAYDRLKKDGYIRTFSYRGTYLQSLHPLTKATKGKIGVLVSEEQSSQPLILWYEHVILQFARRKGLVTEVRSFSASMDLAKVSERGFLFGPDVSGIVSLTPFRQPPPARGSVGRLPLVFLCPPYERCVPKVCADVREAYYDITSRFIRDGHRRIVFSEDSVEPDARQTDMHREGYLEAMQEHGLPVDEQVIKASRRVNNANLDAVAGHLKALLAGPAAKRPTSIVAGSLGRAMALTRVAPLHRIQIPDHVSVASIGSADIEGEGGRQISGMLPDFDRMVELCLTLLDEQAKGGRSEYTELRVRMHPVEGHTIRSLADRSRREAATNARRGWRDRAGRRFT